MNVPNAVRREIGCLLATRINKTWQGAKLWYRLASPKTEDLRLLHATKKAESGTGFAEQRNSLHIHAAVNRKKENRIYVYEKSRRKR
jgi:hypothetical protein